MTKKHTVPTTHQPQDKFNSLLLKRRNQSKDIDEFDVNSVIFNEQFFIEASEKYVTDMVSHTEQELFRTRKIRRIYKSFEHLILDNIQYYSRIIRTIYLLFENRNVQDGRSYGLVENPFRGLSRSLYKQKLTPTQVYYLALLPSDFTYHEFMFTYPDSEHEIEEKRLTKADRAVMFQSLVNHNRFKLLHELARINTKSDESESYSQILEKDKTPYRFLKTIMPYKFQKAIKVDLLEQQEDALSFADNYMEYLKLLDTLNSELPNYYASIRTDSVQLFNKITYAKSSWVLKTPLAIETDEAFPEELTKNYVKYREDIMKYHINTEFLEFALYEMLTESRLNIDKFYGIKSLTDGSVSSIRLRRKVGGLMIVETTFDKHGNSISEKELIQLRSLSSAIKIIVKQFNYYVFDIDKANVINTNLESVGDVMNHISEVVTRYQTESEDITDKYNEEVERVMKTYISFIKEQRQI
ncbi:gp72 [Sphingomonas phage PAU]|uniref:gp72 n=1 Tax=Sphingomonas phage PAU TaxID=1150991 RepID=UPI00025731D2|nr:gp72 [Sphingomonas phage PAU]AFF28070.1 gp72 [Sphingomonas phage PAU]